MTLAASKSDEPSPEFNFAGLKYQDIPKNPQAYITSGVSSSSFRVLGTTHLHLDAEKQHFPKMYALVKYLEAAGIPSKINLVHGFIAGPQRADSDVGEFYDSHTPVHPGSNHESFGIFSTSLIRTREQVIEALELIFKEFKGTGAVTEFEQVIGRGDTEAAQQWRTAGATRVIEPLDITEISKPSKPTAPYEIHYGFNLTGKSMPVGLADLVKLEGTKVGGWFISKRKGISGKPVWAYRSNAFAKAPRQEDDLNARIKREVSAIETFLDRSGHASPVSTTLERTLGVWSLKD